MPREAQLDTPGNTVISTGQRATFGSAYTLDGVGNRTQVDLNEPMMPSYNAETINYTYFLGNILNTVDGSTYTHDANGNRTSKTNGSNVTTYSYDSLNRLIQTVKGSQTTQYIYNGLGQRVGKIDNGVQTNYLIDPNGILPQVMAETDASNNLISFYVYDGAGLVTKITPDNKYYFYHYDGLGNTIAITDSSGQVVNTYCYSPEGLVGTQETIPNPFQYVGRFGVMAEGNGLYYMRARYYDPEVGRFINKDPIKLAGGDLNLYAYSLNDPINLADPWGLSSMRFFRGLGMLLVYDNDGNLLGLFAARNNTITGAKPWPEGKFAFKEYFEKEDVANPCSQFGKYGFFWFEVKGRTEMGLHSGRDCPQYSPRGIEHPTKGCIRTTDEAMKFIKELHEKDPLKYIEVVK